MDGIGWPHHAPGDVPPPDAAALQHGARLEDVLRAAVTAAGGRVGFDQFMDLALYAPGLGYYSAGAQKIGAAGDFVTAPEISPLFSRCLARQCAEVLTHLGGGDILELGAGSGAMACEVLGTLSRDGALPDAYLILEVSAELRERQRQRIAGLPADIARRVRWLEQLPRTPLDGVIIANEVVDALPARRFRMRGGTVRQLGVGWQGDRFNDVEGDPDPGLPDAIRELAPGLPEGYTSEYRPLLAPWIDALGRTLGRGVLLVLDYGYPRREYYHPDRHMGTLLCHYRHRAHGDPYLWPGLQDISVAVDFTALAEAATGASLAVRGFTTQAHFLIGCGLEREVAASGAADARARAELARQVGMLTLPGEMGEVFKALALARGYSGALRGFQGPDHRHRL